MEQIEKAISIAYATGKPEVAKFLQKLMEEHREKLFAAQVQPCTHLLQIV